MAEALTLVGFAAKKLCVFLAEEGKLLGGLGQEVQFISDEFGHIKAFLDKFADSDHHKNDPQLCEWIRQARDVSYETEDVIDEFLLLFANHPNRSFPSLKNLPAAHQLATKLQSVKARITNIAEAHRRYEPCYANTPPGHLAPDSTPRHSKDDDALLAEESQLVGINKTKRYLISQLRVDSARQIKVIAVVGMGGLGKTTLVRKVYDDAAVKSQFQIRAWVTVSQKYVLQDLLKGLSQQLLAQFNEPIPPKMNSMSDYKLKDLLKELLRRRRYAIVFDDVWDTKLWDAFKIVLPENDYGGNRVMLTTRIADVAPASSPVLHTHVYKMGCLSSRDSWTLFCRKTFKDKHFPDHLKAVAESIVAKCGGLPLAIVAIAGLLASKDSSTTHEWELVQHRLRDELEGTGKLDRVGGILAQSYNDLPSTLKACLVYTGILPQGIDIPIRQLIHLLVAERFVEEKEGLTAEEVAWGCLKELANRSLIQLNQVQVYNGLSGFIRIHDLLREFIASKSEEQNMVAIISASEQMRARWTPGKVVRRLVFDFNLLEIISSDAEIPHYSNSNFRSIISFGEIRSVPKPVLTKILTCSQLLTMLDLSGMHLEEIPLEIFKLHLLRYLAISGEMIKTVPTSIKKLRNLEFLTLKNTSVRELPKEIQKLHKLRHLSLFQQAADSPTGRLAYNGFKAPSGMGTLVELQTLYVIDASQSDKTKIVKEIGQLTKLRTLWMEKVRRESGKELCSSLEKLKNLRELSIASSVGRNEVIVLDLNHPISAWSLQSLGHLELYGRLEKIPPWIRQLQGLEIIELSLSNLEDDPLETLQHLPNLSEVLLTEAYQGETFRFKTGKFLKLKKLTLKNMKGLKRVIFEEGGMPGINELNLDELPLLTELPFGIEHLRQLKSLQMRALSSQLTNKLNPENAADDEDEEEEEESEDFKKISHVPQVLIGFRVHGKWKTQCLSKRRKKVEVMKKETQLKLPVKRNASSVVLFISSILIYSCFSLLFFFRILGSQL